jgi:hypothetical protein
MRNQFLLGEIKRIEEGAHGRLAIAPSSLMFAFIVVLFEPRIKISLQGVDRLIDFLAEDGAVKLVEHGRVQPLDDSVGLRRPGLGASVVDVFDVQIQLVFMMLGVAAEFRATVRQHAQQRNVEAIEERNDAIIEQIGRG